MKLLEIAKDKAKFTVVIKYEIIWAFIWPIGIWPWHILKVKVKVMHFSTVNILEMVNDMVKINIPIK